MKKLLVSLVFASMFLVAESAFAQVSVGIRIGPPPRPRVVKVVPRRPGAEFVWVEGYWYPVGRKYKWHDGYWTRPPYPGARWISPRYENELFFEGYWDGDRGRWAHDHRSDHDHDRDDHRR